MLDSIKSALNRIRPGHRHPPGQNKPEAAQDTFGRRSPRPPYDPHKPHGARASRPARRAASATPRTPQARVRATAPRAVTPARMSAAHHILEAMLVGDFVMEMLLQATCPKAYAGDPHVEQLQLDAIQMRFAAQSAFPGTSLTSLMDEAARDLCHEFAGETLLRLQAFGATEEGSALFAGVPRLLLLLRDDDLLGPQNPSALRDPEGMAFAACVDKLAPGAADKLRRLPPELLASLTQEPFTPDAVDAIALFLQGDTGRAFTHYVQRACWLGVPNAVAVQRSSWIRGVQSDMVGLLEASGVSVPPPWGDMPVYVPSFVKIEEL